MRRHADGCTAPPINAGRHIAATVGPVAAMRITSVHELLQRYLPTRPRVANCLNHRGRHRREGHAHDRGQDTTPACAGPPSALIGRCRMGGRAVEGTGLENRRAGDRTVGSNPTPSANPAIDHLVSRIPMVPGCSAVRVNDRVSVHASAPSVRPRRKRPSVKVEDELAGGSCGAGLGEPRVESLRVR